MSAPEGFSRSNVAAAASGPDDAVDALHAWARVAPVALAAIACDGVVAWVNPAFERLTGFAAAQAVGSAIDPLLDAAAPPWLPPAGELARRRLLRQDGVPLACDAQVDSIAGGQRLLTLI